MDFFESQDRARRTSGWLVVYFGLAVLTMVLAIYAVVVVAFTAGRKSVPEPIDWWQPGLLLVVVVVTCTIILLGSLYKTIQLRRGGGASVAMTLGGQQILPNTTNPSERRLMNVVEEMALAAGVPVPPVYVLENEHSINAFAAGFTVGDAVIGVNRGTLRHLSRDELQGVIAHEFSHILHGDMRLNLKLIGLLNGILVLAMIGYYFMRFGGGVRHSSNRQKGSGHLALVGLAVFVIGYVGLFFARLIKAAVARQREYLADASAVQFTRNPGGLGGALEKIGGLPSHSRMETPEAESASHMFFGSFRQSWFEAFATHPPLPDRILRLDPQFDGNFPRLEEQPREIPNTKSENPAQSPFDSLDVALPSFGGGRLPLDPAVVLATIGAPTMDHVGLARELITKLPAEFKSALHDPFAARLAVLAMLLDDRAEIQATQLAAIRKRLGDLAASETPKLRPTIEQYGRAIRLPLIEIVQSTLQQLSPDQYQEFRATVVELIEADQKVDFLEFTVSRTLLSRLDRHYRRAPPRPVRYLSVRGVTQEVGELLSLLVHIGHKDENAAQVAFELAAKAFASGELLELRRRSDCSLARLHEVLEKLASCAPVIKRRIIRAASVAVASDGQVTPEEAELLRAVADSLDCPVPPLFAGAIPTAEDVQSRNTPD